MISRLKIDNEHKVILIIFICWIDEINFMQKLKSKLNDTTLQN